MPGASEMKTINALWIGNELSPLERLTAASFIAHGHSFHLYAYGPIAHVPAGVTLTDANAIIPERDIFLSHGGYAHFADWFRWRLLMQRGGFWTDMDVVCLRPFEFGHDVVFGYESGKLPNVAVMGFSSGHPVCEEMESRCAAPNVFRSGDSVRDKARKTVRRYFLGNKRSRVRWGEAGGPSGFRHVLAQHGLQDAGLPFTYFYPISWQNAVCLFDKTLAFDQELFSDTHAVHLWNEMLRLEKIDKRGPFVKGSFVDRMLDRYGV